jgi:hypothetical protein
MSMVCPSDRLRVDGVILPICADEADIKNPVGIIDPCDDPIFVPGNIEHDSAVFENARRTDLAFRLGG